MTAFKVTLLATQWLLLSVQALPETYFGGRQLTPAYVEYLRGISILPPPEFDHVFKGELTVKRGTQNDLRSACPNSFDPSRPALGCAKRLLDGQICVVYILNDIGLQMTGWDYEIVLRHEVAHCNGWRH